MAAPSSASRTPGSSRHVCACRFHFGSSIPCAFGLFRSFTRPKRAKSEGWIDAGLWGPFTGRQASDAFDDQGDALADADAHGAQRIAAAAAMQLVDGGGDQPRTAGAERMAQGNGAPVRIDARIVVGQAKVAHDGQSL